jgi:hypothetical protein
MSPGAAAAHNRRMTRRTEVRAPEAIGRPAGAIALQG